MATSHHRLTGHEDSETYHQALEAGADDSFDKPLEPGRLISRIRSRLNRDGALRHSAARDPLTGLMDVAPPAYGQHLFALAVRNNAVFSLCVLRLERFQELIAEKGLSKANEVLRLVALVLKRRARTEDIVVHYRNHCFLLASTVLRGWPRSSWWAASTPA